MTEPDRIAESASAYEEAARAHLLATRVYLAEVMGRQSSDAEVSAVWAKWLHDRDG